MKQLDYYPDTKNWSDEERIRFMEENDGLVISLVSKFANLQDASMDREDLYQIAREAFWRAFSTYDPEKGTRFTTYARYLMKNDVYDTLRISRAKKRVPEVASVSYESLIIKDGDQSPGEERRKILNVSYNSPVEKKIEGREILAAISQLLEGYAKKSQYIFLNLALKIKTQQELAKELDCSQANISMQYKIIKCTLCYDLTRMGFSNPFQL